MICEFCLSSNDHLREEQVTGIGFGDECASCFGLFEHRNTLVEEIVKEIATSGYALSNGSKCFVSIAVPPFLLIRHYALFILSRSKSPSDPVRCDSASFDVATALSRLKVTWRSVSSGHFKALLLDKNGLVFIDSNDGEADLNVCVQFELKNDEISATCGRLFAIGGVAGDCKRRRRRRQQEVGRDAMLEIIKSLDEEELLRISTLHSTSVRLSIDSIAFESNPIYVTGRYNKFCRNQPQSPWFLANKCGYDLQPSIEEVITKYLVVETGGDNQTKFSSAGREDIDVRMLSNGRPFVIKVINPKVSAISTETLFAIEKRINEENKAVCGVRELSMCNEVAFDQLMSSSIDKRKHYRALCFSSQPLDEEKVSKLNEAVIHGELLLKQITPLRVAHRRSIMTRDRSIYSMRVCPLKCVNANWFVLDLVAQSGTYIKEFVHGDFGRTDPSISSMMGCFCDIASLDVTRVDLEWPPTFNSQTL